MNPIDDGIMPKTQPASAAAYLAALPDDRRTTISTLRDLVLKHLPPGYIEMIGYGVLTYGVPLSVYPNTYNGQPLLYAGLASQKHYCSFYLTCAYMDERKTAELKAAFAKAGKKLNMGKCCVRFRTIDDLPLPAIGKFIASVPMKAFIRRYEVVKPPKKAVKKLGTK